MLKKSDGDGRQQGTAPEGNSLDICYGQIFGIVRGKVLPLGLKPNYERYSFFLLPSSFFLPSAILPRTTNHGK
ncbi:MAG: hypothetical protein F6K24_40195, partial [Okeania sp. SIO2D1]|nr:hypothetical protein [Okeania sp. SIO2D1]